MKTSGCSFGLVVIYDCRGRLREALIATRISSRLDTLVLPLALKGEAGIVASSAKFGATCQVQAMQIRLDLVGSALRRGADPCAGDDEILGDELEAGVAAVEQHGTQRVQRRSRRRVVPEPVTELFA